MKGIIQAYAFFILWIGLSVSFLALIRFDHHQYLNQFILKQALQETALLTDGMAPSQKGALVYSILEQALLVRQPAQSLYRVEVMGLHLEPFALRVVLNVNLEQSLIAFNHRFDETIVEVSYED